MPSGGTNAGGKVDLDAIYADAMQDRFVLFSAGTTKRIGRIKSVVELARRGFGLAAKVSEIDVEGIDLSVDGEASFANKVRETTIHLETAREWLIVVHADVQTPATVTDRIIVQGSVALPVGRRVVLTGEQWAASGKGPQVAEVATLKSSSAASDGNTELVFEHSLASRFRSTTLELFANCVRASHGETPDRGAELIGSGNAATASPRFQLKGSPLAYVPAANSRGYAPAIEVRVDDRLYSEEPTIFGLDSGDRAYTVKTVRDGISEVQFAGRLPSGTHNVSALYRVGGGLAGNLPANRLTTAMKPVLGVNKVDNLVAAEGASDAETVADMRSAAPQSIRTLNRVVSLADFEAFARSYRGIGKAIATELHVGMRSVVCITIATTTLTPPVAGSDVVQGLRDALALVAPPGRSIRIEGFCDLTAQITIAMATDPALRRGDVEAAVRAKLGAISGRAARNFGEALHRSAVLSAVQSVDGVIAVTLPVFLLAGSVESEGRLLCPAPSMIGGTFKKAGLLSIDPASVQFMEMLP
jgi:predicted phage baseplate assembly protein